ncbi:Pvc16 family protein [Bacteroides sp. UBA939]|uniref:Pvc16 family protein n=1 Tax=Bacteroides sp. UBA939 TaxID=1946092 RepID=UPI0025B9C904|nr:Pvc16 family protein [Bacteroides sp. UBA939]
MIKKIVTHYASRLDEYLRHKFPQPEGMAEVGFIGNSADEKPCKLVVSLVNIERETAGGIAGSINRSGMDYTRTFAPLLLNLDLMLAAVYDERRYAESLSVLHESLLFIQSHPFFELDGQRYTVEVVTLSTQDINNIWSTLGGQYYPSVMCKLRRLAVDANEAVGSGGISRAPSANVTNKRKEKNT